MKKNKKLTIKVKQNRIKMFDVGGGELLLIILVILILFGPEKIPEIARFVNKGVQKIRQAQSQIQSEINSIAREMNTISEDNTHDKNSPRPFPKDFEKK